MSNEKPCYCQRIDCDSCFPWGCVKAPDTSGVVTAMAELHRSMAIVDRSTLWHLVHVAYHRQEISIGKVAELLGLPIDIAQLAITAHASTDMAAARPGDKVSAPKESPEP